MDENGTSKFPGEGSLGPKSISNHYVIPTLEEFGYDCAIMQVDINDILRNKNRSELETL